MESFTLTTTANSTTFASLPFYSQPVFHARKSGILNFSCRKPRNFWVSASKDEPKLDEWDNMELKFGRMIGEDPKITLAKADMQSGEKPFFSDELSRSTPTVSMELIGKLERLDHAVKPADKQIRDETRPINPASLVNPFELENFLAKSSIKEREDDDWTRVEEVVKTGEREEVEVISTSSRGFVVSCGSLIGFLPYRNLAARWKFLAFDSWLRRKGLDPSLYRQNMGILGKYEATSMTGNSESATNSEIGSKNDVAITSDMKLELRRRCVLHFTGESRERRNMKELALQYTIPFPTTTKLGILPRKTFPHFQFSRNKVSKSTVDYSSTTIGSRRKSTTPLQVEELEDGLRISRYYVRSEDREGEEEEDEATSSSMLLSLSMKPDRNMAMLDDYEMEEMDYVSLDPNHRSGYVAVVGKPNVGKSTLSNQMVGQKLSIVTDKPQTTRHRILGICSASEYQMILYDTPGVIEKKMHKLDSMMMKNVRSAAINANCVVVVVDACRQPETIDQVLEQGVGDRTSKLPTLLVLNKKDLIKPGEIAKKIEWYEKFTDVDEVIPVSAKFGHGVDDVKEWILSKLPLGPAYYPKDISSEHPERFFVAEIVREKIFMQYRKEIPYACQVNVLSYQARPNAKDFIQVEIVVEKNSQKIILIGKEGKALKVLATAARLDIEDFLQKKVFLEIEVKVKENWRQNEGLLKYYGYGGQIQAL